MTELKSYHINKTPFIIYNTENVIIFTARKIATQFLDKFYRTYLHNNIQQTFSIYKNGVRNNVSLTSSSNNEKIINSDVHKLLVQLVNKDNNFDKEIIILIRDPLKRHYSGFIQDYIKPLRTYTNPIDEAMFNFILKSDLMYNVFNIDLGKKQKYIDTIEKYLIIRKKSSYQKIIDFAEEPLSFLIKSMLFITKNTELLKEGSTHIYSYHKPVLELLRYRNPKVIDIDDVDNLSIEISKITGVERIMDKYHTSDELLHIFKKVIDSDEFSEYKSNIENIYKEEIDSYNKLKNLNFNLDNSN